MRQCSRFGESTIHAGFFSVDGFQVPAQLLVVAGTYEYPGLCCPDDERRQHKPIGSLIRRFNASQSTCRVDGDLRGAESRDSVSDICADARFPTLPLLATVFSMPLPRVIIALSAPLTFRGSHSSIGDLRWSAYQLMLTAHHAAIPGMVRPKQTQIPARRSWRIPRGMRGLLVFDIPCTVLAGIIAVMRPKVRYRQNLSLRRASLNGMWKGDTGRVSLWLAGAAVHMQGL